MRSQLYERCRQVINEEDTLLWLSSGSSESEIESEVIAVQVRSLLTKYDTKSTTN
jgi:hypothetical protein